jgi:LysM repeat protein
MRLKFLIIGLMSFFFYGANYGQQFQAQKSDSIVTSEGEKYYIHQVVKGNTLYNISKTYSISANEIEKINMQLKEGLKVGTYLKIPFHTPQNNDYIYHIVKKKETLYQIAQIYNVKIEDITNLNDIENNNISVGQYLKIPSIFSQTGQLDLHKPAAEVKIEKGDKDKYAKYTILKGETLFTISKKFGISIDAIMYLNDLQGSNIQSGQELLLPKNLLADAGKKSDSNKYILHEVKPKETLYGLAKKYAVSIDQIVAVNKIENQSIKIGQVLNIPRKLNSSGYIEHEVVERRDKLSKLAGKYQVSLMELRDANPKVKERLKKGTRILIPIGYVETDFQIKSPVKTDTIVQDGVEEEDQADALNQCIKITEQKRTYNIALMMPLYLDEVDSLMSLDSSFALGELKLAKPFKFIEFFEGFVIAAEELSNDGLDFNIQVYDVPREDEKVNNVLSNPNLLKSDLIVSLLYRQAFKKVSEFSNKNNIPLVNVLSKRRKIIYDNPHVFKIEPNQKNLYKQAIDYVLSKHLNDNVIIVRSNPYQLASDYQILKEGLANKLPTTAEISFRPIYERIEQLKTDFEESHIDFEQEMTSEIRRQIPNFDYERFKAFPDDSLKLYNKLQTVVYSQDSIEGLLSASTLYRNNLILALGTEEVFGIELFTKLNSLKDSLQYEVIGMPYWHEYYGIDVSYTQALSFKTFTNRFVDYDNQNVQNFIRKFRTQFVKEPEERNFAFLGYDVALFFLTTLKEYGTDFYDCIDKVEVDLLENRLEFHKIPNAGYENIHWNMLLQHDFKYHRIK